MNNDNNPIDYKRWSFLPEKDNGTQAISKSNNNEPEQEKKLIVNFKQLSAGKSYRSEALSLMRIDDVIVSKSSTMTDFKLTVEQTDPYNVVRIEISNTHVDNSVEELNQFNGLLYKIASVKNNLILKIDKLGSIIDVLNKQELREKWLEVKAELRSNRKFSMLKPEDQEKIFNGGDEEYLNNFDIVEFLNKGYTIYAMLFMGYWQEYNLKTTYPLSTKYKSSTLFKDYIVPLEFEVKLKRYNAERNFSELEMQGIEPDSLDMNELRKRYQESYPFAKVDLQEYNYDCEINCDIENSSGLIRKMNATVFEKAGSIEMFMDCNIKELRDEESNITE
ncbi:hypothetical protein ACFQ3S_14385 [Mucilaginibacter terrae]|uniref:hypothetical protein n=1 Tax=Mucilaginibacter terrae TaxID=1955052 RepID=UPI003624D1CF